MAVATLATSLVTAAPAQSAAPTAAVQDPQCADAFPVAELVRDMPVTGMTVSAGTTPDPFTGTVLGVLEDGIAPGMDMIMVRLTSPEIDRVGGIWAGMSGSPVYAADGRLIGAVAYGLAGTTPVAGVTPAESMQALLDGGVTAQAAAGKDHLALPDRAADRLVAQGYATRAEVDGGLQRLPLAFGVSGMANAKRLRQFAHQFGLENVRIYRAGRGSAAPAADIVAGGNLAVTLAYGDLTAGGVGTATQVCGDEVIAFGHPAYFTGPSNLTMHGADAIYVQEDRAWIPFKVANFTDPVGIIVDDRLAGVHGFTGTLPESSTITSDTTSSEGATRNDASTSTSVEDALPEVAAFHLLTNLDRVFDGIGEGSSRVRMTVTGERANGRPFEVTRVDVYASTFDITFDSIFDSYEQLYRIVNNRFEDVKITDVDFRAFVDRDYREYRIGGVQMKVGGSWVKLDTKERLAVRPGQLLRLRLTLRSLGGDAAETVDVQVRIPAGAAGKAGSLRLAGGGSFFGGSGSKSFADLLSDIASEPHNNDVLSTLRINRRGDDLVVSKTTKFSDVVNGGARIRFQVAG
jgi:hypothetical protein